MSRILVTGSRDWEYFAPMLLALREAWNEHPGATLVHGACRGADEMAAEIWDAWGFPTEAHPITEAEWLEHSARAGYLRNQRMVDLGADLCLAFPMPGSRGTKMCVQLAERAGIPVRVINARA